MKTIKTNISNFGKKLVVVLLAVMLVATQASYVFAAGDYDSLATAEVQETVGVALDMEHSYLVSNNQVVAPPASGVYVPVAEDFVFTPKADNGYELDSVTITINGEERNYTADANGAYTIPSSEVNGSASVKIVSTEVVSTQDVSEAEDLEPVAEEEVAEEEATEEETTDEGEDADGATTDEAATDEAATDEAATDEATTEEAADEEPAEDVEIEEERTKTEYVYEDSNVKVVATLTDPTAVPDNAEFRVTPVTADSNGYNYDAYMDALNDNLAEDEEEYTSENTLLYDVAFMVQKTDEEGNAVEGEYVEYQPEAGAVQISFQFKSDQLSDDLGAEDAETVEVGHLPLVDSVREAVDSTEAATDISAADIKVEDVSADVSVEGTEAATFSVDNLSVFYFKDKTGQKNYWPGTTTYSIQEILSALGDTTQYAVYANKLINGTHLEGNIKVGVLDAIEASAVLNQDANVIQRTTVDKITVTKTVSEGATASGPLTFNFGAYDVDNAVEGKELNTFSITVPQGETSASFVLDSKNAAETIGALSSKNVVIYELDSEGNIVKDGEKLDGTYTVSYKDNEVEASSSTDHFTNYIGSITNSKSTNGQVWLNPEYFDSGTFGSHTYIESYEDAKWGEGSSEDQTHWTFKSTTNGDTKTVYVKNYKGRDSAVAHISQLDGITAEVSGKLVNLSEFSAELANAKNGYDESTGGLSVINVISTTGTLSSDLDAANFWEIQNGKGVQDLISSDGYLLINIDVSNISGVYTLDQIKSIDSATGKTWGADGDNEELARHIILNFVTKSGTSYSAYTGGITVNNVTAGTILAPAAKVTQVGGIRGIVIADEFDRTSGNETHKDSLVDQRNAKVYVSNTKEEQGGTTARFSAKKTLSGKDLTEGAYSFVLKDSEGNIIQTKTNDGSGNVTFDAIEYTEAGEYTYTISEVKGTEAGIVYDETIYNVKVVVAPDASGNLTATITYTKADGSSVETPTFANRYVAAGEAEVSAAKAFNNWSKAPEGGFVLQLKQGDTVIDTQTVTGKDATVTFKKLTYTLEQVQNAETYNAETKSATFSYTISEQMPEGATAENNYTVDGITYDPTVYGVTVTVTDDGTGKLKTEVKYDNEKAPTFTNTYNEGTSTSLSVTKSFSSNWPEGQEFTFELTAKDDAPMPSDAVEGKATVTVTKGNPKGTFSEIAFDKAGTYTYYIQEVVPEGATYDKETGTYTKDGVTYDATKYEVTVTVTPNADGTKSVAVSYQSSESLTVTNDYKASGKTPVSVKKSFNNWGDSSSFDFNIEAAGATELDGETAKTAAQPMPTATRVTAKSAAAVSFGDIAFTETGIYKYKITEVIPADATEVKDESGEVIAYTKDGITYDASAHYVTITVTDDHKGTLVPKVVYSDGETATEATFTNTYNTKGTSANLVAKKNFKESGFLDLSVFSKDKELNGGEFTFEVLDATGKQIATATNDAKGDVVFPAISYTEAGEYTYTIREIIPADKDKIPGVTYDDTVYTATVVVVDNGKGELEVKSITYAIGSEGKESADFTNTYKAEETDAEIKVTKNFDSWKTSNVKEFTFTLTPGKAVAADGTTEIVNPLTKAVTAKATEASKTASFGKIAYKQAGTYYYTITESYPEGGVKSDDGKTYTKDGVTYDITAHTVVVTVTDDGSGQLKSSVKYDDALAEVLNVTNTYKADKTSATLEATKTLTGADISKYTFSFQLKEGEEVLQTVSNNSKGKVVFTPIEYTEVGTHNYTIVEVVGDNKGMVYDTAEHKVTVEVTDNGAGKLVATVTYDGSTEAPVFTNKYSASGEATIQATKSFNNWGKVKDGFTFELTAVTEGAPMPESSISSVATEANPTAVFGTIKYTTAGEYIYTISEAIPSDATPITNESGTVIAYVKDGVTYDAAVRTVKVIATDDGKGTINTQVIYYDAAGAETSDPSVFTNTYAEDTTAELGVTKSFKSDNWPGNQTFSFKLAAAENESGEASPMPEGTSEDGTKTVVVTKSTPSATFGSIAYTKAGVYNYTINEVVPAEGAEKGVVYDTTTHTATVTVTENADGTKTATVLYDGNQSSLTVENDYKASDAEATVAVKKNYNNWGNADSFTFTLHAESAVDEANNSITPLADDQTLTVTDGDVHNFETLTFSQAGTYKFSISEIKGENPGISYSEVIRYVTIKVTDNGEGQLVATTTYEDVSDQAAGAAQFTNTYTSKGTSTSLAAKKTYKVNGNVAELKGGEFTFILSSDAEGASVIATAQNDSSGNVTFSGYSALSFETAGTYTFYIREQLPAEATAENNYKVNGLQYDPTVYEVTVVVTDNGQGQLVAATPVYKAVGGEAVAEATFENSYTADATELALQVTKDYPVWDTQADKEFEFTLTGGTAVAADGVTPITNPLAPGEKLTAKATKDAKTAVFSTLEYKEAGTYNYTISEVVPTDTQGVTYDKTIYNVVVTVTDNNEGKLVATAKYNVTAESEGEESLTIKNSYTADGTNIVLAAKKTLEGAALTDGRFQFTLSEQVDGQWVAIQSASNKGEDITFSPIEYTEAGEHLYKISEVATDEAGVTYDTTEYEVKVTVTDNGQGKLVATADYGEATPVPAFKNSYFGAKVTLDFNKYFFGTTPSSFSFTLKAVDAEGKDRTVDATKEIGLGEDGTLHAEVSSFGEDFKGVISFAPISYTEPGEYYYLVSEDAFEAEGVQGDTSQYLVKVTVNSDQTTSVETTVFGEDAFAAAAVKAEVAETTDEAESADEAEATDEVEATVETEADADATDDEATEPAEDADAEAEPAETAEPTQPATAVNTTYEAGEFYNNELVTLSFASFGMEGYTEGDAKVVIDPVAYKKYVSEDGEELALSGDDFEFELVDENGNVLETIKNKADGSIHFNESDETGALFKALTYTQADVGKTFNYTIREKAGSTGSIKYDTATYRVVVTVGQKDDGTLEATVTYLDGTGAVVTEPTFTNTAEGYDLKVRKVSREGGEGLVDCTYALWMVTPTGDVQIAEATSDSSGYIHFQNVELIKGVKYYFKEVKAPAGHTVDPYRTAYFSLNDDGTKIEIVEDTADDGWHPAGYKDGESSSSEATN